ncbi:MAG: 16S rRNA (guanine(527)-N(7))-methyltransferase RsmG [Anaeroplasmataceae bacterium]|nr:16S rRNA (guanine(527)-N(7))-methyltransferase RsmG [Anaeroplasmataceae bacterium]
MDFREEVFKLAVKLTSKMEEQFKEYFAFLVEKNQVMNLTAITEEEEVYRKHFLDSLELLQVLKDMPKYTLCDVGSGAGFPSIPLAIVHDQVEVTIIDALNKRIGFLKELVQKLDLNNVEAIHSRAEDYAKIKRESFDVVTARAVARLNVLSELCLPLTKVGGLFLAMKGSSGEEELRESKKAIELLGGSILKTISFTLPDEQEQRQIIVIKKIKPTPVKYPRSFSKIKERAL